jgi:hypothetical protein
MPAVIGTDVENDMRIMANERNNPGEREGCGCCGHTSQSGLSGMMQVNNRAAGGDDRAPAHRICGGRASPRAARQQIYRSGLVQRLLRGIATRCSMLIPLKTIGKIGFIHGWVG